MKTKVSLKNLKEFTHALEYNKINYIVIAGFGVDGKRGYQTRPHQDLDILCLKKDLPKIENTIEKLNYSGKKYNDLYKLKRDDGSKVDLGLVTIEGEEAVTYGRIAVTRFPKELFNKSQRGHIKDVEFNIAPNELLKKWGSYATKGDDKEYIKNLPINSKLFNSIKRKIRNKK